MDFDKVERDAGNGWETYIGQPFPDRAFRVLCESNLRCCEANMGILEHRRRAVPDAHAISMLEATARRVGEIRVRTRGEINVHLATQLGGGEPESLDPIDLVASVGDMLDRMSIEWIKGQTYDGAGADKKREMSRRLYNAAHAVYLAALLRAKRRGAYHCFTEPRTYS